MCGGSLPNATAHVISLGNESANVGRIRPASLVGLNFLSACCVFRYLIPGRFPDTLIIAVIRGHAQARLKYGLVLIPTTFNARRMVDTT